MEKSRQLPAYFTKWPVSYKKRPFKGELLPDHEPYIGVFPVYYPVESALDLILSNPCIGINNFRIPKKTFHYGSIF